MALSYAISSVIVDTLILAGQSMTKGALTDAGKDLYKKIRDSVAATVGEEVSVSEESDLDSQQVDAAIDKLDPAQRAELAELAKRLIDEIEKVPNAPTVIVKELKSKRVLLEDIEAHGTVLEAGTIEGDEFTLRQIRTRAAPGKV